MGTLRGSFLFLFILVVLGKSGLNCQMVVIDSIESTAAAAAVAKRTNTNGNESTSVSL